MDFIDFIIGVMIANGLVHFILGITKTHFLGLFGYSPKGNIAYGLLQFVISIILIFMQYKWHEFFQNGILLGALSVLIIYLILGRFLVTFFGNKKDS